LQEWDGNMDLPVSVSVANDAAQVVIAEEKRLSPAGEKGLAVVLDRLFSVLTPPSEGGMKEWFRQFSEFPDCVLDQAATDLIRTHKYPSPPSIADFLTFCEQHKNRERAKLHRAQKAQMVAGWNGVA